MNELDAIKAKIDSTETKLALAETALNDTSIALYGSILIEQQKTLNILLSRAGNLQSHRNAILMLSSDPQYWTHSNVLSVESASSTPVKEMLRTIKSCLRKFRHNLPTISYYNPYPN